MSKRAYGAAALLMAVGLAGCGTIKVPEDTFFYPNARVTRENIQLGSNPPPAGSETLPLSYAAGEIGATRVRAAAADKPLILYCGGNMFRRESEGGIRAQQLTPFGDLLMFDYPGYGDTAGDTTFANFSAVGRVVADTARRQADAERRQLVVWGRSMGGIVCSEMAQQARADVLVLETTTPSARAAVEQQAGMAGSLIEMAPALAAVDIPASLEGFGGKIIVLEAGKDKTLPPVLSQRLTRELQQRNLPVERLVFPEAGHSSVGRQPDFAARIGAVLQTALAD